MKTMKWTVALGALALLAPACSKKRDSDARWDKKHESMATGGEAEPSADMPAAAPSTAPADDGISGEGYGQGAGGGTGRGSIGLGSYGTLGGGNRDKSKADEKPRKKGSFVENLRRLTVIR